MTRHLSTALVFLAVLAGLCPSVALAQYSDGLATGRLLVARESLKDPNFSRTVLLILRYDERGAAAVVLNRPSHMHLDHLLPHLELTEDENAAVYVGGPVAVRMATILATAEELEGDYPRVVGNIHVTADLSLLERMVADPQSGERFRVYAGHAGWESGQLESEMKRQSWYVFPASEADIYSDRGEELWHSFIERTRSRVAWTRPPGQAGHQTTRPDPSRR